MLPSTGHFKTITCPFYESGLCERPYCHFRHVRRDSEINNDTVDNSDNILKQLVSEAVKKVLQQTDAHNVDIETKSQNIISEVVKELKPNASIGEKPPVKATYNPTPIAELNRMHPALNNVDVKPVREYRKHIPVPYTPHRPSRSQLTRAPVKMDMTTSRLSLQESNTTNTIENEEKYTLPDINSESTVTYLPGSKDNPTPYSPMGQPGNNKSSVTYTPSNLSIVNEAVKVSGYSPAGQNTSSGASYNPGTIPASKSVDYCPTNNSTLDQTNVKPFVYAPKFSYKPTPLTKQPSPTFSSDEDEPSIKKAKLTEAEDLDDLDVEFEMLGEILEDENNPAKKTTDNSSISSNNNIAVKSQNKPSHEPKMDTSDTSVADKKTSRKLSVSSSQSEIKSSIRKEEQHCKSSTTNVKLQSKNDTNEELLSDRNTKSSKSDYKHSSKRRDEKVKDIEKEKLSKHKSPKSKSDSHKESLSRDKSSSSKDKESVSRDKHKSVSKHKEEVSSLFKESKRIHTEVNKKSSHDHKKIEKTSNSGSSAESKHLDSVSKHSDKNHQSKPKTNSSHDSKTHSTSSSSDKKYRKSLSDADDGIIKTKDKYEREKSSKSSHSSSSKHSSKVKSNERSSKKTETSHSKEISDKKSATSKFKPVKQIDLFSVSKEVDSDKDSDEHSYESETIEIISDSDEEDITQECMKIFEEYVPVKKSVDLIEEPSKQDNEKSSSVGKKRIAHNTNIKIYRTPAPALPNHKTKAVQMVTDRYAQVKQFHNERLNTPSSSSEVSSSVTRNEPGTSSASSFLKNEPSHSSVSSTKIRIAHVPYASTLLNAKKALKAPEPPKNTPSQTISKGTNRVAHMPSDKFSERPSPLEPLASKVPINIRSKYLNLMIDSCLKIYLTAGNAYERALQEELATNKKCTTISIYKNSAIMAIARLRKEVQEADGKKISNDNKTVSHNKIMLGKKGETVSWSIENKYRKDMSEISKELKGNRFYEHVHNWVLTEEELRANGFPRPHPEKRERGCAKIYTQNTRHKPQKGFTRCCVRCKRDYVVDKKGVAVVKEDCIYHPNNKYRFRGEVKYQCCSQDASSDGCLSASCHVYEYIDHENLRGYVTTLPKEDESFDHGIYALDCEMSYTTNGLDLTRVTVINSNLKVVYETLVRPIFPIIDYNTNFSGITEDQMKDVTTSLLEVQATLLHMFSDKTILVGHSLESDFKALKLIHNTVVDTSVLFPHKMGPPYKRALRNLSSEYLKKIIQNSVDGHDSAEDALVCLELLMWKVKEELKTK